MPKSRSGPGQRMISRRVAALPASPIRRFFELVQAMPDAISLSIGEPDFVTPWHVREEAIFSLERGATHYTSNRGLPELRKQISQYLARRFGLEYDPETEILATAGVSQGLDLALRVALDPGDVVIIPEPCYVSYAPCTTLAGGEHIFVSTRPEDGFRLRAESVAEAAAEGAKALLLGYPNNPTGAILDEADLRAVAEAAKAADLLVISDEIYAELTYDRTHVSIAGLPGMRDRTIVLGGFSKGFAMTGWRLGWACAPGEIIEAMTRIHSYTMLSCSTMAQRAAVEALRAGDRDVAEMREQYDQRRRVLLKRFSEIGIPCPEPLGAFYAFPNISGSGLPDTEFAERLLNEQRVAVVPGSAFGPSGAGHVRCSYATSLPQIEEALKRIAAFLASLAS